MMPPLLALLSLMVACGAQAAMVEEVVQLPVEAVDREGKPFRHVLTVTVFRDDAREKSPFLILNHGRGGNAAGRQKLGRVRYAENAAWFVARGFAVFVLTRVGYGVTGGPDLDNTGPCDRRDFPRGFEGAAAQSIAVIRHARSQPFVDAQRGVLVGQSFGGAATVALAAREIDGVKGAINFAGGGGGDPDKSPEKPCSAERLAETLAGYGKAARVPMLWLYSENDRYWGRDAPRAWFERYNAQGGDARFVQLPPSGTDGHSSFTANREAWTPHVEAFLKSLGIAD